MEILLLIEKWCDLNKELGMESSTKHKILGPFLNSNLANIHPFFYDEFYYQNGYPIQSFICDYCKKNKIDVIIASYNPHCYKESALSKRAIATISKLGIPIVLIWFDYAYPDIKSVAFELLNFIRLNVILDVPISGSNFIHLWSCPDTTIFYSNESEKDIDVSFVGTMGLYQERSKYVQYTMQHHHITWSGGQREHKLTIEEYADVLRKSKITLNFCGEKTKQLKGRIFEAMLCGCLLLEKDNDLIKKWYTPNEHYVPFKNKSDLVKKIKYYLKHKDEREEIALSGTKRTRELYSPKRWVRGILDALALQRTL